MTDYADIVKRLRANLDKYPGFVNLNADAATAMETLLAQRAVLVKEVEAARTCLTSHNGAMAWGINGRDADKTLLAARAATDAAFPEGLTK